MDELKVAILGFGTVGEGVYKTIQSHEQELQAVLGKNVKVAAILIKNKEKERKIAKGILVTTNFNEILALPKLDIIMEAIVEKEPSFTFLKKAIKKGCHIVTANKEMFAHHGKELIKLAKENNVKIGFEATVAGGIPIIQTLQQLYKINRVKEIQGILNGTSNFILTEMRERKQSFADALKLAQEKGYAEADPTNDVEGIDAFYKLMILSRLAFGEEPDWKDVDLEGITSITSELVEKAQGLGLRYKHIATIARNGGKLIGSVQLVPVGKSHPFYQIEGVQNAVNIQSDIVGNITLQGPGAGMFPTASAMIEDLVYVNQSSTNSNLVFKQAAISDVQDSKELWIVTGIKKKFLNTPITWIEQLAEGIFIIKAARKDVEQLAEQNKAFYYFQAIGSDHITNQLTQELITAAL